MGKEQDQNRAFQTRVDRTVRKYQKKAHQITDRMGVVELLDFTPQQGELFEVSLAQYLLDKRSADGGYYARRLSPFLELGDKIPGPARRVIADIMNKDEVNRAAVRQLKTQVHELGQSSDPDQKPTPWSILKAANYLSDLYLEHGSRKSKKELERNKDHVNFTILGREQDDS